MQTADDGGANEKSRDGRAHHSESAGDGSGLGSARTAVTPSPSNAPPVAPPVASNGAPGSDGTLVASGSGIADFHSTVGTALNTGAVTPTPGGAAVAPWYSPTWPADRAAAMDAVRAGHVPDAYREMVGDYFERK
jgi:hypothetical protein